MIVCERTVTPVVEDRPVSSVSQRGRSQLSCCTRVEGNFCVVDVMAISRDGRGENGMRVCAVSGAVRVRARARGRGRKVERKRVEGIDMKSWCV